MDYHVAPLPCFWNSSVVAVSSWWTLSTGENWKILSFCSALAEDDITASIQGSSLVYHVMLPHCPKIIFVFDCILILDELGTDVRQEVSIRCQICVTLKNGTMWHNWIALLSASSIYPMGKLVKSNVCECSLTYAGVSLIWNVIFVRFNKDSQILLL